MTLAAVTTALAVTTATRPACAADDPWWGPDKAAHLAVASAIGGGGYALGTAIWPERSRAILLGAGAALLAGAVKEGLDAAGLGDPSWKDFTWDAIGAACGVGIAITFDVGIHGGTAALRF
jgi:putative lipoprotein